MHELTVPEFLDPRWFNQMRGGPQTGIVIDAQSVQAHGVTLRLSNPGEVMLIPGQRAYIILSRNFILETQDEHDERERRAKETEARRQEEYRTRLNRLREDAERFNATLHIPARWVPGMKDVLSGLSANSMGNGRNAATVEHIWLREALHDGKFHRECGDFLCTSAGGSNGKQWSAQTESVVFDGEGRRYQPKVTCKVCLKIAKRWEVK